MSSKRNTALPSWVFQYLALYKRHVVIALALGVITSACSALLMFTSGYLISATAQSWTTLFSIMVPIACVQLFGIGRPMSRYIERLVSHDWVLRITSQLRRSLFGAALESSRNGSSEFSSGEYLSALSDDISHLQNLFLRVVFPSVVSFALAALVALCFGFFSAPFGLAMLIALFGIVFVLPYATLLVTRALNIRAKSLAAREYDNLADDMLGAIDLALARRSEEALARHAQTDSHLRKAKSSIRMATRSLSLVATLVLGALACVIIVWCSSTFPGNTDSARWVAAFVLGFFPLIEAFAVLPDVAQESAAQFASLSNLDTALSGHAAHEVPAQDVPAPIVQNSTRPISAGLSAVVFENVHYAYPSSSTDAVNGVSLEIPHGQKVALLGPSGSGKTTLAKLMRGMLAPDSGSIALYGRTDLAGPESNRAIGYLPQKPYVFDRSLKDNLKMAAPEATDEELVDVLKRVGLGAKLQQLENGLDSMIGETGFGLSGGQAHRIALARILLADAPLVIVDEPFSALDPKTESGLLDTLFAASEGRTLIVITHHLARIERFDRAVFLANGAVSLDGDPAKLKAAHDEFASLIDFDRAFRIAR